MIVVSAVLMSSLSAIAIEVDSCVGDAAQLEESIRLELPDDERALSVHAFCDGDSIVLETREGDDIRAQRQLAMTSAREVGAARVVALAAAELVGIVDVERVVVRSNEPTESLPSKKQRAGPQYWALWMQGGLVFGGNATMQMTTRIGASRMVSLLSIRSELVVEFGKDVLLNGNVGAQIHPWRALPIGFGISARVGGVSMESELIPYVAAVAHAKVRAAPVDRSGLSIGVELGYRTRMFRPERLVGQEANVDGVWAAMVVGWEIPW